MDLRSFSLDPDLTAAEVDSGTEAAWHFLPFEDRRADLVALDERYILALGRYKPRSESVAIFDRMERRRTNFETNPQLYARTQAGNASSWCFAPAHKSVFILEWTRRPDFTFPNPTQYLRQLSLDGSVNRRILIAPEFSAFTLLARKDGRIVCVGTNKVAALDPVSGEARVSATDRITHHHPLLEQHMRWFSPDGRWGLRVHPGAIVSAGRQRRAKASGSILSRFFPRSEESEEEPHPDIRPDGVRRFGRALELFRLDPLAFERRLVIRYDQVPDETWAILERLCDERDPESRNARDQWLSSFDQYAPEVWAARWLYDWIERIDWDADGAGFAVSWSHAVRDVASPLYGGRRTERVTDLAVRHVSLAGAVGPVAISPGTPRPLTPLPSEKAIKAVRALIRDRSTQTVDCGNWTGTEVAAALRGLRDMIAEKGLGPLVFGGMFQLRFRIGKRALGEKKFFETVRVLEADEGAAILPELRALLTCYAHAARELRANGCFSIASGPGDQSPAALSEAALTLAQLDDDGFDPLRAWVETVDQEHDPFAAAKVLPAVARRTGWATAQSLRFGLWFFLQQWQTVKYEKGWLGLFKAAPSVFAPAAFAAAVLEEAQAVERFSDSTSIGGGLARVQEMLGRSFWDRAVAAELDRLIASVEDGAGA